MRKNRTENPTCAATLKNISCCISTPKMPLTEK
jgi:hypothetical protein